MILTNTSLLEQLVQVQRHIARCGSVQILRRRLQPNSKLAYLTVSTAQPLIKAYIFSYIEISEVQGHPLIMTI